MNKVQFDPKKLSGAQELFWKRWKESAEEATAQLLTQADTGTPLKFQPMIWSRLKAWLLDNFFHGKCAYCESHFAASSYGAADHYRPKGRVTERMGGKHSLRALTGEKHPGYFWLAYDWKNLLPCCDKCNTGGKLSYFPIEGTRCFALSSEATSDYLDISERPLLLHPYHGGKNHPRRHLQFHRKGYIKARNRSLKGKTSIEIYNLKRSELRRRRRQSQINSWNWFLKLQDAPKKKRMRFYQKLKQSKKEHSAACLDYIKLKIEKLRGDVADISSTP